MHTCPEILTPHLPTIHSVTESLQRDALLENLLMIIVGGVAGGLLIMMLIIVITVTCHHKRKNKKLEKELTEKRYGEIMMLD